MSFVNPWNSVRIFLSEIFAALDRDGVDVSTYEIDHLCWRCANAEAYGAAKEFFAREGRLLTEAEVNGRPIATYWLDAPVTTTHAGREYRIPMVEIPAPKLDKFTPTGWEHMECVVDGDPSRVARRYPALTFDERGLQKRENPELELSFGARAVKFHPTSLLDVIQRERWNGAFAEGGPVTPSEAIIAVTGEWLRAYPRTVPPVDFGDPAPPRIDDFDRWAKRGRALLYRPKP